jgi:hypothetical protein
MKKIFLFILVLVSLLIGVWFKGGNILGTAEDGLIFYNVSNYFHQAQYTWMEYPGLGGPSLSIIAAKPTYLILSFLQKEGVPGFIIQAAAMWILMVTAAIGVYFLVKELFPKLSDKYVLFSILFYLFNPISTIDVWNRFLFNYISFFALLPLTTYLYIKGLRSLKYFWIFVLNLVLIFFSDAFSYIAFILLIWIWLATITFFFSLVSMSKQVIFFSLKYLLLNLIIFFLINSWWILPLVNLNISGGASGTTNIFMNQSNQLLLDALSKTSGNLNGIFKFVNSSFLAPDSLSWMMVYYSPFLYIIQFFFMGSILYFLIRQKKDPLVLFLGCLLITIIFLSKGNSPPFGEVYNFIYRKILILQVFRNPFEKFGFLLSLIASVLLAPSLWEVNNRLPNSLKRFFYPVVIMVTVLLLGFPSYSGLVLTNKFPPTNDPAIGYQVKVPQYYREVDEWLKNKGDNFRYIGLPLKDEGITYKWEKGYAGAELTVPLFSNSGLLLNTSTPFFNQIVPQVEKTIFSGEDFSKLANLINARFYLLRYDIDYKLRGMTDPQEIEKVLVAREKNGEVKKIITFGKVEVWENLKWKDSTFYPATKVFNIENDLNNLASIDVSKGEFLISDERGSSVDRIIQPNNLLPETTYKKINSTNYLVHVRGATKPFVVVFSELYNQDWKASYDDKSILENHIQANIYANGWVVDRQGDFNISVVFTPQKWMDIGEKISITSYIIVVCSLLFLKIKKKI